MKSMLSLVAAGVLLLPAAASAQVVIRDNVDGWGWMAMIESRRAVARRPDFRPDTYVQAYADQIAGVRIRLGFTEG